MNIQQYFSHGANKIQTAGELPSRRTSHLPWD